MLRRLRASPLGVWAAQVGDLGALPAALHALRAESANRDRGFNARQLLTRSRGERRRRGSVLGMDPKQQPVHAAAQVRARVVRAACSAWTPSSSSPSPTQPKHHQGRSARGAPQDKHGGGNLSLAFSPLSFWKETVLGSCLANPP